MTLGTMSLGPRLPETIVDCHHHFLAPDQPFHATLGKIGAPAYTAEQYATDCGHLPITKTVHVEALADEEALGLVALADLQDRAVPRGPGRRLRCSRL